MKRHHITLGATTNAGGKVITASHIMDINGVKIALEGDTIACTACKSTGRIQCMPPRQPESFDGRIVALEHDLCICKCRIPPLLVANQGLRYQTVEGYTPEPAVNTFAQAAGAPSGRPTRIDATPAVSAPNVGGENAPVGFVDRMGQLSQKLHVPQGVIKNSYDEATAGMENRNNSWGERAVHTVLATAMLPLAFGEELTRGVLNIPSEAAGAFPKAAEAGKQAAIASDSSLPTDERVIAGLKATSLSAGAFTGLGNAVVQVKAGVEFGVSQAQSANAANRINFNSGGDRLIDSMGSARVNNAAEYNAIVNDLKSGGVEVSNRTGQFAYGPASSGGKPGNIVFDPNASISAIRHEYGHYLDDAKLGFPGQRFYYENPSVRVATERRQYLGEIRTAKEIGDPTACRQLIEDYLGERKYLVDNYYTKPYGSR
jgi:uncharacterized Zn-binding protein involved in type VI secretion